METQLLQCQIGSGRRLFTGRIGSAAGFLTDKFDLGAFSASQYRESVDISIEAVISP